MKKVRYLLVLLLILLLILTACSGTERDSGSKGDKAATGADSADTSAAASMPSPTPEPTREPSPTPSPSPSPTPSPTPSPSPSPSPTPTPEPSIYDNLTETEDACLYLFDPGLEDAVNIDCFTLGDTLILHYLRSYDDFPEIISYDLLHNTCESITIPMTPSSYMYETIGNDTLVITDTDKSLMYFYGKDLKNYLTIPCPYNIYNDSYRFSHDAEYLYYVSYEDEALKRYSIKDMVTETVWEDSVLSSCSIYQINDENTTLTLTGWDSKNDESFYIQYDLVNSEKKYVDRLGPELHFSPDGSEIILCKSDEYFSIDLYDTPEGCTSLSDVLSNPEYLDISNVKCSIKINTTDEVWDPSIDWDRRLLITSNYTYSNYKFNEYSCYSLDDGKMVSNCIFNLGDTYSWLSTALDTDKGIYYLTGEMYGKPLLYVWDYSNDNISDLSYTRMNSIPDYLNVHRMELEDKYNIFIYLGSEVFATDFGYDIVICKDFKAMDKALYTIDEVFSLYPEGFFDQFKIDGVKTLGVYLCSGFIKTDSTTADNAIALAAYMDYERLLALDVTYGGLDMTLVHELSHWIDHRIESEASFNRRVSDFDEKWLELNPAKFNYDYDYNGSTPYYRYLYSSDDIENSWFTDSYAQTWPTEDRSRLFENLMYYQFTDYFKSEHMRDKLKFYFSYIRKCFDTTGWPEETSWEQKLREVEEYYTGSSDITLEEIYPKAFEEPEYEYYDPEEYYWYNPEAVG